jgi:hypothetical protein
VLLQDEEDASRIVHGPRLKRGVSFFSGKRVTARLPTPLTAIVEKDSLARGEPRGSFFVSDTAPIVSERFARFLAGAGIDNVQLFPVVLKSSSGRRTWSGYYALNVIGLRSVESLHTRAPVGDSMLFRRAEDPKCLCVDPRFEKALNAEKKVTGLGRWYVELVTPFDFLWFRRVRFRGFARACNRLRRYHDALPYGRGYGKKQARDFAALVAAFLAYGPDLPDAGAGRPEMKKLARAAKRFAKTRAWNAAQEIDSHAFTIHNYMTAVCDCPEKDGPYV